jgi:hypothetical protein
MSTMHTKYLSRCGCNPAAHLLSSMSVYSSVCRNQTTQESLTGFSWILILGSLNKICQNIPVFVIMILYLVIYMKIYIHTYTSVSQA